jgi:hypothetical protein
LYGDLSVGTGLPFVHRWSLFGWMPLAVAEAAVFNALTFDALTIGNGLMVPAVPGGRSTTAAIFDEAVLSAFQSGGSFI